MLALAVPLADAWQRVGAELHAGAATRQSLAPLQLASRTQQALAAHQPYAHAVLAGRTGQEPERALRQAAVDAGIATLAGALEARHLHRALEEADQLRADWSALMEGLGERRLTPPGSDLAHELLIEQTFVVADLAAAAGGWAARDAAEAFTAELALARHTLPRFAATLAQVQAQAAAQVQAVAPAQAQALAAASAAGAPTPPSAAAQRLRAQAGQVARAAAALLDAQAAGGATADRFDAELAGALLTLRHAAVQLRASAAIAPAPLHAAAPVAQLAQAALMQHVQRRWALHEAELRRERAALAAAGLLAMLILLGAARLALPPRTPAEEPAPPAAPLPATQPMPLHHASPSGAESTQPTHELLQRLRQGEPEAGDLPR